MCPEHKEIKLTGQYWKKSSDKAEKLLTPVVPCLPPFLVSSLQSTQATSKQQRISKKIDYLSVCLLVWDQFSTGINYEDIWGIIYPTEEFYDCQKGRIKINKVLSPLILNLTANFSNICKETVSFLCCLGRFSYAISQSVWNDLDVD